MSYTTTFSLGCTFVTLARSTSSFLREWLFTGACNITKIFCLFQNVSVFVLKVVENILNDIASQR